MKQAPKSMHLDMAAKVEAEADKLVACFLREVNTSLVSKHSLSQQNK